MVRKGSEKHGRRTGKSDSCPYVCLCVCVCMCVSARVYMDSVRTCSSPAFPPSPLTQSNQGQTALSIIRPLLHYIYRCWFRVSSFFRSCSPSQVKQSKAKQKQRSSRAHWEQLKAYLAKPFFTPSYFLFPLTFPFSSLPFYSFYSFAFFHPSFLPSAAYILTHSPPAQSQSQFQSQSE